MAAQGRVISAGRRVPADERPQVVAPDWLLGLALAAAVWLAYQPAWHGAFIWDDDVYVTKNPLLTDPNGLRRIWFSLDSPSQYFPLTYTTFYLERPLWGLNPAGYHWVNLLLHCANAWLVWRLLRRLCVPGAWLAAGVFALHPVQVESVAWITERKNVLMAFFFLLTLLAWLKFIGKKTAHPWRFYLLALVFYALALFAKTTACTLPAALVLILWLEKLPIGWRRLAQVAPFVAMGIGMGWVTVWWEGHHQGTEGELFAIPWLERGLIASRAVWFYAGQLLWPANLAFSYPRWTISASDPAAYVGVLATAVLGAAIWRARRWTGRSVEVAAGFFGATLSPVLGFIMLYTFVYSFVADHYLYVACLGPIALAAAGIERGLGLMPSPRRLLRPLFCAGLLVTLAVLTWHQCAMYANPETLWRTTLARNPASWLARNNLGKIFGGQGDWPAAIEQFRKALEIYPDQAKARHNLGRAFLEEGDWAAAIGQFQKALEIKPDDAPARLDMGDALLLKGDWDGAVAQYQKALAIQPALAAARHNLVRAWLRKGDLDQALACYTRAAATNPDLLASWHNLGSELLQKHEFEEAVVCFRQALKINPSSADTYADLGVAFIQKREAREAMDAWEKSLEINPGQPDVQDNLAWLLATTRDSSIRNGAKAEALATQANLLSGGGDPMMLHTLAAAYAEAGRYAEAKTTARRALGLALEQKNAALAASLQKELQLYEASKPLRSVP